MAKTKTAYRPDQALALARIEAQRKRDGISRDVLAITAGMSERTYRRAIAGGRAWPRQVDALRMSLRSLARELREGADMFPGEADT